METNGRFWQITDDDLGDWVDKKGGRVCFGRDTEEAAAINPYNVEYFFFPLRSFGFNRGILFNFFLLLQRKYMERERQRREEGDRNLAWPIVDHIHWWHGSTGTVKINWTGIWNRVVSTPPSVQKGLIYLWSLPILKFVIYIWIEHIYTSTLESMVFHIYFVFLSLIE